MSKVFPREFDISDIRNIRFKCLPECGSCCFTGFVSISTTEIRNILDFLRRIPKKVLNHFITNWTKVLEESEHINTKTFSEYKHILQSFHIPGSFQTKYGIKIVKTYFIYSFKPTGRCVFLDPIDLTCLIFSVRPIACRLCPITAVAQPKKTRLIIGYSRCPGLNKGDYINIDRKKIIVLKGYAWLERDFDIFKKFISDEEQGLTKELLHRDERHDRAVTKRIVDPFVKKGIIPPSTFLHQNFFHEKL